MDASVITQVPQGSQQSPQAASTELNNQDEAQQSNKKKDTKKRSNNFLCSIICCLGKKSSKFKGTKKGEGGGNNDRYYTKRGSSKHPSSNSDVTDQKESSSSSSAAPQVAPVSPGQKPLLPAIRPQDAGKKCIVIDLDETLVHSSFKPISNADFIVPVEIDNVIHQVYVLKRPYVDEFLIKVGELFECVLFTASLAKYADPVADLLDKWDVFHSGFRLFRESCVFHKGNYVKDLSKLGRDLPQVIIVDNSPASYIFHPENAIPCASWFDDMNDRELLDLIPLLEQLAQDTAVYRLLKETFNSNKSSSLDNHNGIHGSAYGRKPAVPSSQQHQSSNPITSVPSSAAAAPEPSSSNPITSVPAS